MATADPMIISHPAVASSHVGSSTVVSTASAGSVVARAVAAALAGAAWPVPPAAETR